MSLCAACSREKFLVMLFTAMCQQGSHRLTAHLTNSVSKLLPG